MYSTKNAKKARKSADDAASSTDQEGSPKKPMTELFDKISGRKQYRLWKKLKREEKLAKQAKLEEQQAQAEEISEEPSNNGRKYTVSIAVPGSILDNAQSFQLRTYVAGQIARAAAIYNVDEIVVFDDMGITRSNTGERSEEELLNLSNSRKACLQMSHILQYLECPQYLRKYVFPIHKDLENAGVLNPLDSTHHFRENEESVYREGYVRKKACKNSSNSYVYVGLKQDVLVDRAIVPGVRVTVKLQSRSGEQRKLKGSVVAPHVPRTEGGLYWGYNVRMAHSLGAVLAESPFPGGYDLTVGTSDKGESVDAVALTNFSHMLVVFGGLKGLEASLEADEGVDISESELLFHHYLNMCPGQGSKTIRTEEAVLISLTMLRPKIKTAQHAAV